MSAVAAGMGEGESCAHDLRYRGRGNLAAMAQAAGTLMRLIESMIDLILYFGHFEIGIATNNSLNEQNLCIALRVYFCCCWLLCYDKY